MVSPSSKATQAQRDRGTGLREALAAEARRLVEEGSPDGLTLRAAAKAAGVSHNAPYIYFPGGISELLATVAIGGFGDLLTAFGRSSPASDRVGRVRELVERYVRFGVENPNLYRAMFHARLADPLETISEQNATAPERATYVALHRIKMEAYTALVDPLEALHRLGQLRAGSPSEYALSVAALAHGLVGEFIDEGLGKRFSHANPWSKPRREMTRRVTDMLLYGLLAPADYEPSEH